MLFRGCVQKSLKPTINTATELVLNAANFKTYIATDSVCCGALEGHLSDKTAKLKRVKENISHWKSTIQKNKIDFSKSFETNFIKTLQDKGINFRLFTFHRAAIPEGTDFGIKNYKGLRSYYLTEQTAFIPRFLNLEYNPINSTSKSITKKLKYNFDWSHRSYWKLNFRKINLCWLKCCGDWN